MTFVNIAQPIIEYTLSMVENSRVGLISNKNPADREVLATFLRLEKGTEAF